jgi:hypothetical protein
MSVFLLLSILFLQAFAAALSDRAAAPLAVKISAPPSASAPVPSSFVSYSIEFAFFPNFAGNKSSPNEFSYNLLQSLGAIQGATPIIRVGGNTQDYYLLDTSQSEALIGTYNFNRSYDYPTTITIGPSFFESYETWPGVQFTHGFNLAKSNNTVGIGSLLTSVPLACKALTGKLLDWELGNEPDLYPISSQGPVRPLTWHEADYVAEWLNLTAQIQHIVSTNSACAGLTKDFIAPSFAGPSNYLNPIVTWADGLDTHKDISRISSHNYIGGATQPGVTLQGTLMNHSSTVASISHQLNESSLLAHTDLPFILGETNSLYNEGAPGLSNAFGAALWGLDFNLYCATTGIRRVHMHQGSNYRYAAWQPVTTANTTKGTKPPYYGSIAVAESLGDLMKHDVRVAEIKLPSIYESAYATYVKDKLKQIIVVQMREFNYTNNTDAVRPSETYDFQLPKKECGGMEVGVRRLMANGSDAISGITFDGYSYNLELDNGKPVLLKNVTRGETLKVGKDGVLSVDVPWSSAALLEFKW